MAKYKIGSVTHARRARELLRDNGVKSNLVKTTGQSEGCAYRLEINDNDAQRAEALFRGSDLNVKPEARG